jgi:hypothetical protein
MEDTHNPTCALVVRALLVEERRFLLAFAYLRVPDPLVRAGGGRGGAKAFPKSVRECMRKTAHHPPRPFGAVSEFHKPRTASLNAIVLFGGTDGRVRFRGVARPMGWWNARFFDLSDGGPRSA